VDELREEGLPVLDPHISTSVKVKESHEASQPLPFLVPKHKLTGQFEDLYRAVESARFGD
jgi:chromosome partitioning protein